MTDTLKQLKTRALVPCTAAIVVVLALAGCAATSTGSEVGDRPAEVEEPGPGVNTQAIHDYVAMEVDAIPQVLDLFDGLYSELEVQATDAYSIEYTYTFATPVDPATARSSLADTVSYLEESSHTLVFPAMSRVGVPSPISNTYSYKNPDGNVVWSHTVTE